MAQALPLACDARGLAGQLRTVIVVGACGSSGSGKTTLMKMLAEAFDSPYGVIGADPFFLPRHLWPECTHGYSGGCEETAKAVDHQELARQLRRLVHELQSAPAGPLRPKDRTPFEKNALPLRAGKLLRPPDDGPEYVFVEGFFVFAEQELVSCFDHLIWLDVDCETCATRAGKWRPDHGAGCSQAEYIGHRWRGHMEWKPIMLRNAAAHRSRLISLANGETVCKVALANQAQQMLQSLELSKEVPEPEKMEVFLVRLMKIDEDEHYLAVDTVCGRCLAPCMRRDGTLAWFERDRALLPGEVQRSAICPDRGLSVAGLSLSWAQSAYTRARSFGREAGWGNNLASDADPAIFVRCLSKISCELSASDVFPVTAVDSIYGSWGGRCRLVKNVLTPEICENLIGALEGKTRTNAFHGLSEYADFWQSQRCKIVSKDFARWIYERMEPAIKDLIIKVEVDPARQHVEGESPGECPEALQLGSKLAGVWKPSSFNETVRFAKYSSGNHFARHMDAMYIKNKDERTLFSCLFYLNDLSNPARGGATNFLKIEGDGSVLANLPAQPHEILASVNAAAGDCLIFFQPGLLHEGAEVVSGHKYIFRTDLVFRRDL